MRAGILGGLVIWLVFAWAVSSKAHDMDERAKQLDSESEARTAVVLEDYVLRVEYDALLLRVIALEQTPGGGDVAAHEASHHESPLTLDCVNAALPATTGPTGGPLSLGQPVSLVACTPAPVTP